VLLKTFSSDFYIEYKGNIYLFIVPMQHRSCFEIIIARICILMVIDIQNSKAIYLNMILRKAIPSEATIIWTILQNAIAQRKEEGSEQWQNGYPNEQTVLDDIASQYAFVLEDETNAIIAYAAIIFGIEPAYNNIDGEWLTNGDYAAVHRVATEKAMKGKGIAAKLFSMIEDLCVEHHVYSIKVDTNFDNVPMLKILDKLNYTYCGEIFFNNAPRKAFEKVLKKNTLSAD
jgi:GNAT superfamily N-acetyltransferase